MEEFKRDTCIHGFVHGYHLYNRKYGREAADAEEMLRERAIARDGKLPVKDPFVSGNPFAGLK